MRKADQEHSSFSNKNVKQQKGQVIVQNSQSASKGSVSKTSQVFWFSV